MNQDDFEKKLKQRVMKSVAKAMKDNGTDSPTAKQKFEATLALYPLEPCDERWDTMTAVLLFAVD